MKKFCVLMLFFYFISVVPGLAMKVIVNEGTDRKVPSRCSGHTETYVEDYDQQMSDNSSGEYSQQEEGDENNVNNNAKYELVYRQLLGENIRSELVGTRWNYPVNNFIPNENVEKPANEKTMNNDSKEVQEVAVKRYLREAADYYFIDTIGSPNDIIPAGFELYSQQ